MVKSLLHGYSFGRIESYQLQTQIQAILVEVLEVGFGVHRFELRETCLEVREFG